MVCVGGGALTPFVATGAGASLGAGAASGAGAALGLAAGLGTGALAFPSAAIIL